MTKQEELNNIVFYDGDCGLCNSLVTFIIKNEVSPILRFTSLQSDFAINYLSQYHHVKIKLNTMYFFTNDKLYIKSNAALEVSSFLNKPYNLLRIFRFVPINIRDWVYNRVANNRKIFSQKKTCDIMTLHENRNRFIS